MKFSLGDPPVDIYMSKDGPAPFSDGEPIAVATRKGLIFRWQRYGYACRSLEPQSKIRPAPYRVPLFFLILGCPLLGIGALLAQQVPEAVLIPVAFVLMGGSQGDSGNLHTRPANRPTRYNPIQNCNTITKVTARSAL